VLGVVVTAVAVIIASLPSRQKVVAQ